MSLDRFAGPDTARATERVARELEGAIERWGAPLEVFLSTAGSVAAVEHGLGELPDGVFVIMALGGNVQSSRVSEWSATTAYLVADASNVRARVIFLTTRKDVLNG